MRSRLRRRSLRWRSASRLHLQKMGYTEVVSIDGGWRTLKDLMPVE